VLGYGFWHQVAASLMPSGRQTKVIAKVLGYEFRKASTGVQCLRAPEVLFHTERVLCLVDSMAHQVMSLDPLGPLSSCHIMPPFVRHEVVVHCPAV
jgi:hypothetical protein